LKKQVIDELRIRNKSPCDVFLSFLDDNGTWNGINDAYSKLSLFASNIHDNDYIAAHFRYVQQPLSIDSQAVLSFRLCRNTRLKHSFIDMYIRATVTLSYLKAIAIDKLNIYTKPNETVTLLLNKDNNDLWIAFDSKVEDCTLEELEFRNNSYICVDIKSITYLPGVRGLRNTGNTCFMNSALQCLSNVPQLTEYFLTSTDISHTRIACVYSELIKALWSEGSLSLALDTFTLVIQADLPRFDNYKQHDAQEFMNYLINILHTELASQSTIITDLFYGKIRSTVHCLTCKSNESTTEVVSFLPLPLTNRKKKQRLFEINHVKLNGDRQSCIIETDSNGTVSTLLHSFIDYCINENQDDNDIPDLESLIVAKMNGNDVKSQYSLDESLKSVVDNQISVFEVPLMISKHDRMYTPCLFLDNDSHCYFRPPIYLVTPKSNCYGQDVAYQIQKIIKHIVSVTGERPTDVFWTSYSSNYQRHLVSSMNENLYSLKSIIIETSHLCAKAYTSKSKQSSASNTSISQELTLSNLMDDFLKEADLDGQYYCSKCKLQTAAKQKSELCSPLPPIIIIQLKRFTYDIYSSDKIDTFIDYPDQFGPILLGPGPIRTIKLFKNWDQVGPDGLRSGSGSSRTGPYRAQKFFSNTNTPPPAHQMSSLAAPTAEDIN
ncbi:unnamed protein product, partial [Didymodactylos carnosus]